MLGAAVASSLWSAVLPVPANTAWQADAARICVEAEQRRCRAEYDTGSITEHEAYLLRALAEHLSARVVIEIGTFIGTSTCALASASTVQAVYTCDASNDCLDGTGVIRPSPKTTSTQMLRKLAANYVRADLCFFDGVVSDEDVDLLPEVTPPDVVFAVHDYNHGPKIRRKHGVVSYETVPRKGIGNVRALQRRWKRHVVVDPLPETTLALLVPEGRL